MSQLKRETEKKKSGAEYNTTQQSRATRCRAVKMQLTQVRYRR